MVSLILDRACGLLARVHSRALAFWRQIRWPQTLRYSQCRTQRTQTDHRSRSAYSPGTNNERTDDCRLRPIHLESVDFGRSPTQAAATLPSSPQDGPRRISGIYLPLLHPLCTAGGAAGGTATSLCPALRKCFADGGRFRIAGLCMGGGSWFSEPARLNPRPAQCPGSGSVASAITTRFGERGLCPAANRCGAR